MDPDSDSNPDSAIFVSDVQDVNQIIFSSLLLSEASTMKVPGLDSYTGPKYLQLADALKINL
jgi:hypothetical protein